jgi:hypothetical protein
MLPSRYQLIVVVLLGSLACTRPSTVPEPPLPSTQASSPEPIESRSGERRSSRFWQISPTSETQHYTTSVTTSIQQSAATQITMDSVTTKAQYDVSITHSANSVSLTGSIQAFSVQAGNRIGSDAGLSSFPISFNGSIRTHELRLDVINTDRSTTPPALSCGTPSRTALTVVQRNLFVTPLQLQSGMTWQDSLVSNSCSGSLELNLAITRNYKVVGESTSDGISVIVIDLIEKTLSAGEGSQDQHRLIIKGEGVKSGRLYVDEKTGALFSLSSETRTILQIQTSGKTQQFLQISKEVTTRM